MHRFHHVVELIDVDLPMFGYVSRRHFRVSQNEPIMSKMMNLMFISHRSLL